MSHHKSATKQPILEILSDSEAHMTWHESLPIWGHRVTSFTRSPYKCLVQGHFFTTSLAHISRSLWRIPKIFLGDGRSSWFLCLMQLWGQSVNYDGHQTSFSKKLELLTIFQERLQSFLTFFQIMIDIGDVIIWWKFGSNPLLGSLCTAVWKCNFFNFVYG